MKASFLRVRKKRRAVLVFPSHLARLAEELRRKNFSLSSCPPML